MVARMKGMTLVVVLCAACSPSGRSPGGGSGSDLPPLRVVPDNATLVIDNAVPAMQDYAVIAHDADGDHDVTADATLTIGNPALGSLAGSLFTSATDAGGKTLVTATWNADTATST